MRLRCLQYSISSVATQVQVMTTVAKSTKPKRAVKKTKSKKTQLAQDSRARAIPTVEERIKYMVGLMTTGKWVLGKTTVELAEQWGLSITVVAQNASEASRLVRSATGDMEQIRTQLTSYGEEAMDNARKGDNPVEVAKAMAQVIRVLADIHGVSAPQKIALTDTAGNDLPGPFRILDKDPYAARFFRREGRLPTSAELEKERDGTPLLEPGKLD